MKFGRRALSTVQAVKFQISDGFVDIVGIYVADGTRTTPDRVTPTQIGHILGGRYSGGRGKPSPLRERIQTPRSMSTEPFHLRFQLEDLATATANSSANADP
jgi:hypothetical protein